MCGKNICCSAADGVFEPSSNNGYTPQGVIYKIIHLNRFAKQTTAFGSKYNEIPTDPETHTMLRQSLNQDVTIGANVVDQESWLGGTQSHLPSGYQRVLTDRERTVTPTQSDPRATMNFEMIYEPKREFIQTQRPSGSSIIRKP